jgi:hypothetical protein
MGKRNVLILQNALHFVQELSSYKLYASKLVIQNWNLFFFS